MTSANGETAGIRRDKLGLALSGGGFRASLFHLGVLRRMAELDILRDVEVLSTVSGGSIVGALYVLFLKEQIDRRRDLSRNDYLDIVGRVRASLVGGIQRNLRLLLFMDPLGILRVLLTGHSLGRRMSRLYERHIYREPVRLLELLPGNRSWRRKPWRPGYIPLSKVLFAPKDHHLESMERYNAGNSTKLPDLILNATSLNSGRSFRFSAAEIGDSRLGLFRRDEIETELEPRKELLELSQSAFNAQAASVLPGHPLHALYDYARWWRERLGPGAGPPAPFRLALLPGPLPGAEFGLLRRAKIAAWYLLRGTAQRTVAPGGTQHADWLRRFWAGMRHIDPFFTGDLWDAVRKDPGGLDEILECVLQIYYLRSAQVMSPSLRADYEDLALSEAVGASACFPPVFPPFVVLGIYDDAHVARLGLTDGGVYDNVGTSTLLEEDCNYIIASDTGALLDVEQRADAGRIGMTARIPGILMDRVGDLQNGELDYTRELTALDTPGDGLYGHAYFHIESPPLPGPGCTTGLDRKVLGRVRTDLDAFGEVEVAALINHGYDVADRHIRKKLDNSPFMHDKTLWAPPARPPEPLPVPLGAREERILRVAQSRFFRALKLRAFESWLFVIAVIAGILYATRDIRLSMSDIITTIANRAIEGMAHTPFVGAWVYEPGPIVAVIAVSGVVAWISIWGWDLLIEYVPRKNSALARQLATIAKLARTYAVNAIWLVGLAPLWIAVGVAAVATVAYLFFSIPFLRKARR